MFTLPKGLKLITELARGFREDIKNKIKKQTGFGGKTNGAEHCIKRRRK